MRIPEEEIQRRMARFEDASRKSGAKLTHQRIEIFRELAQTQEHPDAEKIFQGVRKRLPTVSMDTVYRTLWWLTELGLIKTLGSSRERSRFDANLERHHHFICTQCGLTKDFYSDKFDQLDLPESVLAIGHADITQVEVKGVCIQCAVSGNP